MERRLAAILMADVVGYSRLMGQNESATLDAINEVDPVRGTTGTGFLVGSSGCSVFLNPLRN
jgi:class 3 adenylate cyclase